MRSSNSSSKGRARGSNTAYWQRNKEIEELIPERASLPVPTNPIPVKVLRHIYSLVSVKGQVLADHLSYEANAVDMNPIP